jgi:hypothetical protein
MEDQNQKVDIINPYKVNVDMFTFAFTSGVFWEAQHGDDDDIDDGIARAIKAWKDLQSDED